MQATILNTAVHGIITIDERGIVESFNPAAERLFDYRAEEVLGRNVTMLMPSPHREQHDAHLANYLRTGNRRIIGIGRSVMARRKDGVLFPIHLGVSEAWLGDRRIFVGILHDLTEQRLAEEASRKSEERYRSLFENMLAGFAHCKMLFEDNRPRDFIYLDVNSAFGKLTGLENVVGRKVTEIIPGIRESNPELIEIYGRVALSGKPERFETYVEPLGIWFSVSVYCPQRQHFVAVFDNITDRRLAEERLRDSEARYRALTEATFDGIVLVENRVIVEANGGFAAMHGYTVEEVIGRPAMDLIAEESRGLVSEHMRSLAEGRVQVVGLKKDGRTFPVEAVMRRQTHDGLPATLVALRDVSEQRLLEQQMRQAQKMEAVGRLAGGVAHDFNNLLTVILGEADLTLNELPADHAAAMALQEIKKAGERASVLTRQLLTFSRRDLVEPVTLSLNDLVADMEKMLRRLIGEDVELITRLAPEPPTVHADRGQIEQVLANLVVNARDAMPGGGRLSVETAIVNLDEEYVGSHRDATPGEHAMLAVSDTGIGMTDYVQAHLFEPFFTTKEQGKGTGLGLATVYGIVRQSGGHLGVYSEPEVGTTMRVYLPCVHQAVEPSTARTASRIVSGGETVLLVEDEPAVREVGARILRAHGYRLLVASDAAEALRLLDEHDGTVHLILTDVVLPGMGGRELVEQIHRARPEIKVLFASGYTQDVILQHRLLEREVALLHKPFTVESLTRKVREVLDASTGR